MSKFTLAARSIIDISLTAAGANLDPVRNVEPVSTGRPRMPKSTPSVV